MQMPEDRPDQETFEAGTDYRFGRVTPRQAPREGTTTNLPPTADSTDQSAPGASPAPASTRSLRGVSSTSNSTFEAGSETDGPSVTGLGRPLMNSPRPGDLLFGRYRVERLLGRGGMGEVWLVHHEILRDQFALKLIVPGAAIDEETVQRFVLEAQVMRALSRHPHAVVVHDADIDVDRHAIYIVMDVIHGRSIEKLLEPGIPMPLEWTTQVLGQLCDVLQQAHERGIVHRDLSPANLMLEDVTDGGVHLRVLDFGIAKVLDPRAGVFDSVPLTENGRFFGKRSYASPEQLKGEHVDARSDLYSIGIILYEFLTGHRPFRGNAAQLLVNHCSVEPPWFAEINPAIQLSEQVETVVRRCLEKNPADRPQSARELFELFRAAVEEKTPQPSVAPEPPEGKSDQQSLIAAEIIPPPPASSLAWLKSRAGMLGLAALVCLVLVPLAFVLIPGRIPQPPPSARSEVIEFLKNRGLQPVAGSALAGDGCPKTIERKADRRRFVCNEGLYLPEGYQPDTEKGMAGRLPLALLRTDGLRFLLITGGEFMMGAFDKDVTEFCDEEKPAHLVRLSSFYLQETEVSFGEFDRFCKETLRDRNDPDLKDGFYYARDVQRKKMREDEVRGYPAVGVSRKLAEAYARHVGGELPTEAQWEFAARSRGRNQLYVWGNGQVFPNLVNIQNPIVVAIETLPVGLSTDDRTEQGVLDLAGNVREWCRDVWKIYPQVEPGQDPVQDPASDDASPAYVIRGGSYDTPRETARTTWRRDCVGKAYRAKNDDYELDLGFRVALDVIEVPENLIAHSQARSGSAGERAP